MAGRKNHGNNAKRFDVNSFYSFLNKAHIRELLDNDGNTPYDSDSIDNSVWEYAAYLHKDIQDHGGRLSYFDSDSFRADSDGSGSNNWTTITRTITVRDVYKPLRMWLYSLDSDNGINNSMDTITGNFQRKYYTLPLSDSEGTLRHVNVYTFLKSHFDRWLRFDPYERRKLASRIADNLDEDSDVRYRYADNVIKALEEDSDLSRRLVEQVSNVLQTDSEIRNEILLTTITALQNDSDRARELVEIVSSVLDTDSEVRNEFGDHFLVSLRNDSDQQVELGRMLGDIDLTELNADTIYARRVLPMDSDDTGRIGDSETRWGFGNFATISADAVKVRNLEKDGVVFVGDSEDGAGKLVTSDRLRFNDNDGLVYDGKNILAIDSDKLYSLLKENVDSEFSQFVGLDSEAVERIIANSTILSTVAVPPGDFGNIYYIDSDNKNTLANGPIVDVSSGTDAAVKATMKVGRISHNSTNKKTFYYDGTTYHTIGTGRTFDDVIVFAPMASPPDSDELGYEGLRPGTITVADGVNWDPKSIGGSTAYPVFWDGGQWLRLVLS
jgi:hypothetical protein